MPKQTLRINKFDAGINSVDSQRELGEGQSPYAVNTDISGNGRLQILGSALSSYKGTRGGTADVVPDTGYGLFVFKHDYTMLNSSGAFETPEEIATTYLCKANTTGIDIYDYHEGVWKASNIITFDSNNADILPIFYLVDGGVRICDANHTDMPVKWFGHIKRAFGSSSGTLIAVNEWGTGNARIEAPVENATADTDANTDPTKPPFKFQAFNTLAGLTTGAATSFLNIAHEFINDTDQIATWTNTTTYSLYISALYDDAKQEGPLTKVTTNDLGNTGSNVSAKLKMGIVCNWGALAANLRRRCSGARVYVQDINSSFGQIYQLLDIDFVKGVRKGEAPDYEPWDEFTTNMSECPSSFTSNSIVFDDPPVGGSYDSNNGHYPNEETKAAFKTATVVGRRVYIGAPTLQRSATGNRTVTDLLLKSGANQFDKFPELNRVTAAVNDGDEIVALIGYGQKLLQFKTESLYILDIKGEVEMLEAKHSFMGIEQPYQVCSTPLGIFFINRSGLHWYSGEGIQTLTNTKINQKMWNWVTPSYASIGYDEKNKKLIISRDARAYHSTTAYDARDGWIYDITKMCFVEGSDIFNGQGVKSNFVNTPDGKVIYAVDGSSIGSSTIASGTITHTWTGRFRLYGTNYGSALWEASKYPWRVTPMLNTTVGGKTDPPTSLEKYYVEWTHATLASSASPTTGFSTAFSKGDYFDYYSSIGVLTSEYFRDPGEPNASGAKTIYIRSGGQDAQGSVNNTLRSYIKTILDDTSVLTVPNFITQAGSFTKAATISSDVWTLTVTTAGTIDNFRFSLSTTEAGAAARKLTGSAICEWRNEPQDTKGFRYYTKDLDFGDPSKRKKISRVYVTFRSVSSRDATDDLGISTPSNVKVYLNYMTSAGEHTVEMDADHTNSKNYNTTNGLSATTDTNGFVQAILIPKKVDANGDAIPTYIESAQLVFYNAIADGSVPGGFEINDISISYRAKNAR